MRRVSAIQTPLISNYAHLLELIQQSQLQVARGSCLICTQGLHFRLLVLLSSAACYMLLPTFLSPLLNLFISSFSICSSSQHFLLFPDFHPTHVSQLSLSCKCGCTDRTVQKGWESTTGPDLSLSSLHIYTTASRAMGWAEQYKRLKGQNEDYDTDAFKKKVYPKWMKTYSS